MTLAGRLEPGRRFDSSSPRVGAMTGQENHVLLSLSTLDKVSLKVSTLLCVQYLQYGTSYFDHVAAGSLETLDRIGAVP